MAKENKNKLITKVIEDPVEEFKDTDTFNLNFEENDLEEKFDTDKHNLVINKDVPDIHKEDNLKNDISNPNEEEKEKSEDKEEIKDSEEENDDMANKKKLLTLKRGKKDKAILTKKVKLEKVPTNHNKKKKKKKIGSIIINLILSLLMIIGISAMVAILAFCVYIVTSAPEFDTDKLYNKEATIIYDMNGNEITRIGSEQRELVSYNDLPEVLIDAIVATEDSRFFQHNGFDVVRFVKASLGQITGQDGAGGASTLTMQVAKNTFSRDENGKIASTGIEGIIRKFTDIYMAIFMIERNYPKEEIIEFYVNAPYLGCNTYGVEQASQKYFGKSVRDLSLPEASLLAGIFNSPSMYNPFYGTKLSSERRSIVLNLMVKHGYITEEQATDAKNIPVASLIVDQTAATLNKYQTYIDVVVDEVIDKTGYNPYTTPMLIYTAMDPEVQDVMVALNDGSLGYQWQKSYMKTDFIQFGCAITNVVDGSITAVNGGRHQTIERGYNRATSMKTQPGSTAKPIFAYGPYLEYNNGNTGTLFYDNKMTYSNGQELTNADNTYLGAMTMRTALVKSRNIPAVQAFQAVDKTKIGEFARGLGIDYYKYNSDGSVKDDSLYEAYAIGGGLRVSPLDMAAAYGAFARGGYYVEPYSVTKIVFLETDEVYEHKIEKVQVMSEETAYMITDMLVSATKDGVGGNLNVSGTEIASKTGTSTYDAKALRAHNVPSSASADNWVITYSPDYVISFWYGVDELSHDTYTDSIRAAIERKKISALIGNKIYKKNSKFAKPSGVVSAEYEKETNPAELPSEFTPSDLRSNELFKKGTEPSEVSSRFSTLNNATNGSADVKDNNITISWKEIETPNAINPSYLRNYFNEYYGQFAETYLQKRNEYNASYIGSIGYDVYLSTANGLQFLGYTNNPYYKYTAPQGGTYTFVVKSSYSIFKANASSGISITATVKETTPPPESTPGAPNSGNQNNNTNNNQNEQNNNQQKPQTN